MPAAGSYVAQGRCQLILCWVGRELEEEEIARRMDELEEMEAMGEDYFAHPGMGWTGTAPGRLPAAENMPRHQPRWAPATPESCQDKGPAHVFEK